jgi:KUP system potassium uptake protein
MKAGFSLYALVKKTKIKWLIVPAIGGSALADGIITPPSPFLQR